MKNTIIGLLLGLFMGAVGIAIMTITDSDVFAMFKGIRKRYVEGLRKDKEEGA